MHPWLTSPAGEPNRAAPYLVTEADGASVGLVPLSGDDAFKLMKVNPVGMHVVAYAADLILQVRKAPATADLPLHRGNLWVTEGGPALGILSKDAMGFWNDTHVQILDGSVTGHPQNAEIFHFWRITIKEPTPDRYFVVAQQGEWVD